MTTLRLFIRIASMGTRHLLAKTTILSVRGIYLKINPLLNKKKSLSNPALYRLKIRIKSSLIHSLATDLSFQSLLKR